MPLPDSSLSCTGATAYTPHRDLGLWRKLKKVASVENHRRDFAQHSSGTCLNDIRSRGLRASASQNFKENISRAFWPGKPKRPSICIPQLTVHTHGRDSGYSSIDNSPVGTIECTRPTSPTALNSVWQVSAPENLYSGSSRLPGKSVPPRHVEIAIPPWAQPLNPLCDCVAHIQTSPSTFTSLRPVKSQSSIPCFSRPLNRKMPDESSSKRLSDAQSKQKKRDSGSTQSTRFSTQSAPTSTHGDRLSTKRPASNPSLQASPNLVGEQFASSPRSSNSPRPTTASSNEGPVAGLSSTVGGSAQNLSGLVCNVHHTTGNEPPALVGASTTIVGDKLYVFGGRRLSHRMPQLTRTLYELDLVNRHWTKVETRGNAPIPRYFHSMCALGDSKLVCYGGMAQLPDAAQKMNTPDEEPSMVVLSDVHILDVASRTWTAVPTTDPPPGRYAHCAAVLPSSGIFTSSKGSRSAIQHNPASRRPNKGSLGVDIDGRGGAMMVIAGGQDNQSRYIEQISVFNLRSMKWMAPTPFSRNFGAYRSVVAPIFGLRGGDIGSQQQPDEKSFHDTSASRIFEDDKDEDDLTSAGAPMLLYSNYNFLDVKLELQIRLRNGTLIEKPMQGQETPPGLRFPNGGVIAGHFIVSGTFLTSSKQEYCLWALNLRTLVWNRVDVAANTFTSGSWTRGILWSKRNAYVVLGNRKRNLGDDYNQRRLNFTHLCVVELEAFGLYENPCHSVNGVPWLPDSAILGTERHANSLGLSLLANRDLTDMDILSLTGERIPINSRLVGLRWGPFFAQLLAEADKEASLSGDSSARRDSGSETATLRPLPSRSSSLNMVPGKRSSVSSSITLTPRPSAVPSLSITSLGLRPRARDADIPPTRLLYLPHTGATIRALLHYLYTSTLPPPHHPLSNAQTLCSLLQLARPYRVPGLLEATVQRLHQILDARSAAAIFNATAMAAGGGEAVRAVPGAVRVGAQINDDEDGSMQAWAARSMGNRPSALAKVASVETSFASSVDSSETDTDTDADSELSPPKLGGNKGGTASDASESEATTDEEPSQHEDEDTDGNLSSASFDTTDTSTTSASTTDASASEDTDDGSSALERRRRRVAIVASRRQRFDAASGERVWKGTISAVVGLQKRSLRGLVEGRKGRDREMDNQDMSPLVEGSIIGGRGSVIGSPSGIARGGLAGEGGPGNVGVGIGLGLGLPGVANDDNGAA